MMSTRNYISLKLFVTLFLSIKIDIIYNIKFLAYIQKYELINYHFIVAIFFPKV